MINSETIHLVNVFAFQYFQKGIVFVNVKVQSTHMARRGTKPPQMRIIIMTAQLNTETANKIAELFNTVLVWEDMAKNALERGDLKQHKRNRRMADDALMELDQEFGIELPHVIHAYRRWFNRGE